MSDLRLIERMMEEVVFSITQRVIDRMVEREKEILNRLQALESKTVVQGDLLNEEQFIKLSELLLQSDDFRDRVMDVVDKRFLDFDETVVRLNNDIDDLDRKMDRRQEINKDEVRDIVYEILRNDVTVSLEVD